MSRAQLLRSAEALGYHHICEECNGDGLSRTIINVDNGFGTLLDICPACNGIGRVKLEVVEQKVD